MSFLLVVSVVLCHKAVSSQSILELAHGCGKLSVVKDVSLSPISSFITAKRKARTDVECIMGCKGLADCAAVFRSILGDCYELSSSQTDYTEEFIGVPRGNFIAMISTGNLSDCSGVACSTRETCFKGCGGQVVASPVCVVDARHNCHMSQEYTNGRYYWSPPISSASSSGSVMRVTYPKLKSDTAIRVTIYLPIRGHHGLTNRCQSWYLTFAGNKCTNPASIEQLDYSAASGNHLRSMNIDGTCYGLEAGDVVIDLYTGTCNGYPTGNAHSGWNAPRTMLITEIAPISSAKDSCSDLAAFNYKYHSWNEEVDETFNSSAQNKLLRTINYTKLASDTNLKIKYSAPLSVKVLQSGDKSCGRWFIAIDGTECTPMADLIIYHGSVKDYTYFAHHTRVYNLEGICENVLEAGTHSIEIYMGQCTWEHTEPTNFVSGGFNAPSRIHIEEVRQEHRVDGVYTGTHSVFRSMTGYLTQYHYYDLSDNTNEGTVLTVTYNKQFSDTALRLTSSGSHMQTNNPGFSQCAKWYFHIDNAECSDPGTIYSVSFLSLKTEYHRPMQVSGVCNDIPAGNRTISYLVGLCSGYGKSDAFTGGGSSFYIFVEELRLDSLSTCASNNPVRC